MPMPQEMAVPSHMQWQPRPGQPAPSAPIAQQGIPGPSRQPPSQKDQRMGMPTPTGLGARPNSPAVPKEVDLALMSLPSADKTAYYDSEESEVEPVRNYRMSNRGNKLSASRNARKGRLADWSAPFPSSIDSDERVRKRQRIHLTPNLYLVPKSSNAHPDDIPVEAVLPPPPRNPIDIFTSSSTIKLFSTKQSCLPDLALSAIGLIESDMICTKALTRVCTTLRGDDHNWDTSLADEAAEAKEKQNKEAEMGRRMSQTVAADKDQITPVQVAGEPTLTAEVEVEVDPAQDVQMADAGTAQATESVDAPAISITVGEEAPIPPSPVKIEETPIEPVDEHATQSAPQQPETGPRSSSTSPDIAMSSLSRPFVDDNKFKHLLNPQSHIESLFISPTAIVLPPMENFVPRGAPQPLPSIVSPADQQGLLHVSLTELQRFLADSLEYQERLGEIRDGILAVERRRQGLYAIIKSFAHDYLANEQAARLGQ